MYRAILFAPDGRWVTDYPRRTIKEVQEALADQGSRWYFYPFCGVIRNHALTRETLRLVDMSPPFEHLQGSTIKSVSRELAAMDDAEKESILLWS